VLIVILGSLAHDTGVLGHFGKSVEQRPEVNQTDADANAELKESESWAKAACQAAAGEQLKAALTASFLYDDFAWIDGKNAHVMGSVDIPNGIWTKLRYRYACELAARGQGRWNVTKIVVESR